MLLDKNATLVAGGGLNATPYTYNLARFAIMTLNGGEFNGQQVVERELLPVRGIPE